MVSYRASWVVPISGPPFRDGWVATDRNHIVALGQDRPGDRPLAGEGREVDLGEVAILPGLVNAHTHLELSFLRDRVPSSRAFVTWVRALLEARRRFEKLEKVGNAAPETLEAVELAVKQAVACGTAVVGDISNTLETMAPLKQSELAAVVFYEMIGFNTSDPEGMVDRARATIDALQPTDRVRVSL